MTSSQAAPGRPRDSQVERRIADAAVELFGQNGWASLSIGVVARRAAGVGKACVHLRRPNKEQLLAEALTPRIGRIPDVDTGTVRGDLVQLVRQLLDLYNYNGDEGPAVLRIGMEARVIPRAIVRRGIRRGEPAEDTAAPPSCSTCCAAGP